MASFRKNAEVTVTLNGEAANNMLKLMAERAKAVGDQIREIAKKGAEATDDERKQLAALQKEHKSLEAAQKNVTKATYDYSQVLKNINGSTLRDLEKAKKALRAQLQHLTPETQKYINTAGQLKNVETRIKQLNTELRAQKTAWQNITGIASKLLPVAAIGTGIVATIKKIGAAITDTFKSVQATGDAWAVTVAGMSAGWDYFKRSLVTGDWSNFFSNMDRAIKAGREYARVMDELGERGRSYRIIESETRQEIAELEIQLKNVNLTNKERITIADQIIAKEDALLKHRQDMAESEFKAITDVVTANTNLDEERLKRFMREYEQNKDLIKQTEIYVENLKNFRNYTHGLNEQNVEAIKTLAIIKQKYDKSTDAELEKMVEAWVKVNNAATDYYKNTQTAETRKNRLLKQEENNQKKTGDKELKEQRERLKMLEAEQEEAHQKRLENIKKARVEENLSEAEYNLKAAQEDVFYYKERETALQNFLKTITDESLRADVQKKIAEDRNKQLDADRKADQEFLSAYKEYRDKQLQIVQDNHDAQVAILKQSLAERKITEEQYNFMLLAIENTTADSRLTIQQNYQKDIVALELQSGDLKAKAVEEANAAVVAAEANAADKRFNLEKQLAENIRDFKKQYSLLTVEEEKKIQLDILEKIYQARKEFLEKEGLDTTSLTEAYELAKTNIKLDAEQNRFALRQQLGLTNWQEEYDMEMEQLQNLLDNKAITEEEYEKAKLDGRIKYAKKIISYYAGSFSNAINALQDAELAHSDANKERELNALLAQKEQGLLTEEQYNEQKQQIEANAARERIDIQAKYADANFALQASQAVISGIVAAMEAYKALAGIPYVGPALGAAAAIAVGITTAAEVVKLNAEREKAKSISYDSPGSSSSTSQRVVLPGREEGGYVEAEREQDGKRFRARRRRRRGYVEEPTVLTGEAGPEFVANDEAVANPTVRPVLDMIDIAQRNGSIGSINLPSLIKAAGYEQGGYTAPVPANSVGGENAPLSSGRGAGGEAALTALLAETRDLLYDLKNNGVKAFMLITEFEKQQDRYTKSRALGTR